MRKSPGQTVPLEGGPYTTVVCVERRFYSKRGTRDMLKSLIRAHAEPG